MKLDALERRFFTAILAVLLLAFAARATAAFWWNARHADAFPLGDSDSYWRLANTVAAGEKYQYGGPNGKVFRAPGYPVLLAAWFKVAGTSPRTARYLGAFLGTLGVGAVMLLAHQFGSRIGTLWAGLLAALYPGAISTSVLLLSESPFVPLMLLQLYLWGRARSSPRRSAYRWAGAAGLTAAIACLVRPSWLLFAPFTIAYFSIVATATSWRIAKKNASIRPDRWRDVRIAFVVLATLCVGMSPWWVRNYREVGKFVPTTLQVGASLYDAWNPRATGGSDMWFSAPEYERAVSLRRADGRLPDGEVMEVYLDNRLKKRAISWFRQHPSEAAVLAGRRISIFWNPWPRGNVISSEAARHGIAVGFLAMLAAIGWAVRKRSTWEKPVELLWLPAVYFTLIHTVFVSSIRYRQPAILAAIALVAGSWIASRPHRSDLDGSES